ncbi:hypothetical protein [Nocardia sp. NPDC051570]|uniref:hypothetical protein n=1 Tax=Nocardia sp. NPDC051570 TaxID=3364324 RepID=UPI003796E836
MGDLLDNYNYTKSVFDDFRKSAPDRDAEYDCLFMYSGGKDSTYMLDKFVNEYGKRVLAYTFDVPFESNHISENIKLAKAKIAATFVMDHDDAGIRTVVRDIFNRPVAAGSGRYLDEKLPCASCRNFFLIRAIIRAYDDSIPFIAMCADPQQILTMESNVREIVKGFHKTFGGDRCEELFGDKIEELLFADETRLPRVVFPFIALRHEYDPEAIVLELKGKELYQSSPLETHCTLFPLLNYYSFKNWNTMFYKLNASSYLRSAARNSTVDRSTFSLKFPRSVDLLGLEDEFRDVVFKIVHRDGDRQELRSALVSIFIRLEAGEAAAEFVADTFMDMHKVAADMGIELESGLDR